MPPLRQFNCFYFSSPVISSVCLSIFFVFPFWLFASLFPYLSFEWNNTPLHLHYLNLLDSVDILGACNNYGEVDYVWWNSCPNWLLLVSKVRCSGRDGSNIVPSRTSYPLLWYFFSAWFYSLSRLCLSYLSAWTSPFVGGIFPHGRLWLVPLIWHCETILPIMPPLTMTLNFSWWWRVWG